MWGVPGRSQAQEKRRLALPLLCCGLSISLRYSQLSISDCTPCLPTLAVLQSWPFSNCYDKKVLYKSQSCTGRECGSARFDPGSQEASQCPGDTHLPLVSDGSHLKVKSKHGLFFQFHVYLLFGPNCLINRLFSTSFAWSTMKKITAMLTTPQKIGNQSSLSLNPEGLAYITCLL